MGFSSLVFLPRNKCFGCTVVTDNDAEFARIDGLPCENWLRQT
jgi:tRNA(fMet)-specific endonuclease VapC